MTPINTYQPTIYRWLIPHLETCRQCGKVYETTQKYHARQRPGCSFECRELLRRDYIRRKLARRKRGWE